MNENFLKRLSLWIATLTPLIVLIAVQGKPFFDGVLGVPKLLSAFAAVLPLGTGSLVLSVLVAGFVYYWLERWSPSCWTSKGRDFFAEFAALLTCVTMTVLQLTLADQGVSKGSDLIVAIGLGLIGGWFAPFIAKMLMATMKAKAP